MAEWLKAHAWKVCIRETVSRVRIPLPPPLISSRHRDRLRAAADPLSQTSPPEIDIAEVIGKTPTRYYASVHAREFGFRINSTFPIDTYDLSERFSTFGMRWTRDTIEWTFNGTKVAECATPADLHQPMYLLVNLAVGGLWGGLPEDPDVFPADFMIDYIRVYDIDR